MQKLVGLLVRIRTVKKLLGVMVEVKMDMDKMGVRGIATPNLIVVGIIEWEIRD